MLEPPTPACKASDRSRNCRRPGWLFKPRSRPLLAVLAVAVSPRLAHAHPSGLQAGDPWWLAWHFDPLVAFNVTLLTLIYVCGWRRAQRRAGAARIVPHWRVIAFFAGMVVIVAALMSPLDTLSDDLSWVHMTQHMALMVVAAPLLILGAPGLVANWALPRTWRLPAGGHWWRRSSPWRRMIRAVSWNPIVVWVLHALILWVWHLPVLYELALIDPLVHDIEHLSFFLVACLFWRVTLDPRKQPTLNPGLGVLFLFTTSLHAMVLGVLMALSPYVWYPVYEGRAELWNLSPLEDQQLAGLIMWMPACMVYAVAAAVLFANWLGELEAPGERRSNEIENPQPLGDLVA